ncbi:MAG: RNA methyltransferase [Mucinivorans sp.]
MLTKNEIRFIRSLADKSTRQSAALFVVEGRKMVQEVQNSPLVVEQLFEVGVNCTQGEMERISFLKSSTPVLALVHIPTTELQSPREGVTLLLDGVQDPGNMGTILRSADWFGIRQVVCSPDTVDCYNPKVVQASMGAITRLKVSYTELPEYLSEEQRPIYGTLLRGATNIYQVVLSQECCLVMGSEGHGISPQVEQRLTQGLFIPRPGSGESLNVGVACAVVLSEFARQGALK